MVAVVIAAMIAVVVATLVVAVMVTIMAAVVVVPMDLLSIPRPLATVTAEMPVPTVVAMVVTVVVTHRTAARDSGVLHRGVGRDVHRVQRGGRIHLGGHFGAASLVIGEGIETVLSVRQAMLAHGRDISDFMFWAAVNLGNMGGAAAKSVFHPTLKRKDSRGLERRVKVAGPVPKYDSAPCLMPPDYAREMILLMDGDSDGFTTSQVMLRAAARFQAPGRKVRIARADSGFDFNDMWRAA